MVILVLLQISNLFLDDGGDFAAAGGSFSSFGNAAKEFWGIVTNADQKEDKIAIKKGVDWYEKTH